MPWFASVWILAGWIAATASPSPAAAATTVPSVVVDPEGGIHLRVEARERLTVLGLLAAAEGFRVEGDLAGLDGRVSVDWAGEPLDECIRRLLGARSYTMTFEGASRRANLAVVRVLAVVPNATVSATRSPGLVSPMSSQATAELRSIRVDPWAPIRPEVDLSAGSGLYDPDPEIRGGAVIAAASAADVPWADLAGAALVEENPALQLVEREILAEHPGEDPIVAAALERLQGEDVGSMPSVVAR